MIASTSFLSRAAARAGGSRGKHVIANFGNAGLSRAEAEEGAVEGRTKTRKRNRGGGGRGGGRGDDHLA